VILLRHLSKKFRAVIEKHTN
jgi:hypothetical protein